jgi:hypothetical protein
MGTEATGTVESLEKGWIGISGSKYKILDYVEPFAARRQIGDDVDFQYTIEKDGETKCLTKITAARKGTDKLPPKKPEEKDVSGVFWKSDGVNVALRGFLDGKTRLFCMSPPIAERMKEAVIGQQIKLRVDPNSFVIRFTLGDVLPEDEIAKLLPQPAPAPGPAPAREFKTGTEIAKENLDQLTGPPIAPPAPPQANPEETSNNSTSPSPLRTWSGETTMGIAVTVNLGNYESVKVWVEGAAADRENLLSFLDETLAGLGKNSELTRDQIDAYRKRVLA